MDVYKAAIEKFGAIRQLIKLAEECGELAAAAAKLALEMCEEPVPDAEELQVVTGNLIEEMADVDILIRQFLSTPGYRDIYNFWYEAKISRLKKMVFEDGCESDLQQRDYYTFLWKHGISEETDWKTLWRQVADIALKMEADFPRPITTAAVRSIFDEANLIAVKLAILDAGPDADQVFFDEFTRLINETIFPGQGGDNVGD